MTTRRPDPSVIRVRKDYYLVYSDTQPRGFLLWHSRDLVNWKPVSRISLGMPVEVGLVLAPDFVHYKDTYYIYFPAVEPQRGRLGMKVLHAKSLDGPWSKAIDLGIESHSDPGAYANTSPITTIKQAKTPTLIQQGSNDRRVPLPDSFELCRGLQHQGVTARLILDSEFGHGVSKPKSQRALLQANLDWFRYYIWNELIPKDFPLYG